MKCFIDSLKDCRPLLSKCLWINNVAFCETQGRPCLSSGFLNAGEQNLATVIASMYPFRTTKWKRWKITIHIFFQLSDYEGISDNLASLHFTFSMSIPALTAVYFYPPQRSSQELFSKGSFLFPKYFSFLAGYRHVSTISNGAYILLFVFTQK